MRSTSVGLSMTAVLCYAIVCGAPRFSFPQAEETLLRIEGESVRPLALSGAALAQRPRTVVQVRDRDGTVSAYAGVCCETCWRWRVCPWANSSVVIVWHCT
jgi:hypothetical protein